MIKFSKQEIDKWRRNFVERNYPKRQANLDSRLIEYFVTPVQLFQGIPNGLFRMTGDPQDGHLIGVSAEVPIEIQPHFALSEHDEFMVYGLDDMERTLHSEQNILRVLGESDLREIYVPNKIKLYDHIIGNAKGNLAKWGFTKQDYNGFVQARDFLEYAR